MKFAFALLLSLLTLGAAEAAAQETVHLEGKLYYHIVRQSYTLTTDGTVEQISNYDYDYATGPLMLTYVLSRANYRGGLLRGQIIASQNLTALDPRTYYENVSVYGRSRVPASGRYFVVAALVDRNTRAIYDFHTFSKAVRLGGSRLGSLSRAAIPVQSLGSSIESAVPGSAKGQLAAR